MVYTTRKLVTNSLYLSGIVAREFQTPTGDQITDGLDLLNELLSLKTAQTTLIPYYKMYTLPAVIGQEGYFINNLIAIETFTFNIGTIRYATVKVPRDVYFGSGRIDNILSLPFDWHLEREKGGARIYIYFKPQQTYQLTIWGKFGLNDVTLDEDLSLELDNYYIGYLRYALAEYMCQEYNIPFNNEKKLNEYEKTLMYISPPDLSMQKISLMQKRSGMNYAQANIGRGFTSNG